MQKISFLLLTSTFLYFSAKAQFVLQPIELSAIALPQDLFTLSPIQIDTVMLTTDPSSIVTCNGIVSCSTPLPVTLLQLQGIRTNNYQVTLRWKTQNEINSKGFIIERSLGNASNFLVVGNMASNTSNTLEKNYLLTDDNSYTGTSFYRVKQIDLDGAFTYSNIIEIKGFAQKESMLISPNPAINNAIISCYAATSGKCLIYIVSNNGQTIFTTNWAVAVGNNNFNLPVSNLSAGIYFVKMVWPDGYNAINKLVIK